MQKTTLIKNKDIIRAWHEIDAANQPLGRLASKVAQMLRGKHKVIFSLHQDLGDYVVVINIDKVQVASNSKKLTQKRYYHFSGYPGGLRSQTLGQRFSKDPAVLFRDVVREMLPDNRMKKLQLRRLHIVVGDKHSYPVKNPNF